MALDRLITTVSALRGPILAEDVEAAHPVWMSAWDAVDNYQRENPEDYDFEEQIKDPLTSAIMSMSRIRAYGGIPGSDSWTKVKNKYAKIDRYLKVLAQKNAAANVSRLSGVSRSGFFDSTGLNRRNMDNVIGSYLTGKPEEMPLAVQKSQAQTESGMSGVKGGKRRKTRRRLVRRAKRTYRHSPRKE